MPFVRITIIPALPPEALQRVAAGATRLMAEVLGKKAELTSVLVETAPAAHWTIGGEPVGKAAHLEALVTTGTNSAEQKSAFLAQAMALLSTELGVLPTATYVVVRDIPAGDWGYGGLSQAARR